MFRVLFTLFVIGLVIWGGVALMRFVQRRRNRHAPWQGGGSGGSPRPRDTSRDTVSRSSGPRKS